MLDPIAYVALFIGGFIVAMGIAIGGGYLLSRIIKF